MGRSLIRFLATLGVVALLAAACGASDGVDVLDTSSSFDPEAQDFDDEEFANEDDPTDDDDDEEFDDDELDGPEPDDVEGADPATFCPQSPDLAECDDWLDGLSDAEYCRVLPDDEFCAPAELEASESGDGAEPEAEPELQIVVGPGSIATAGINPDATRDDGLCLPDDDAESDQSGIEFNLAYQVVEGELGSPCFGSPNETVEDSWRILADLVPPGQLRDLAVFAGYSSSEDAESDQGVTLAFVQMLDDEGTQFLMAVNIAETEKDRDEASLTLAHEFTHVFTALPTEIDRDSPSEECTNFDNGEGCYRAESILHQWHALFWADAPGDPTIEADGEQRCELDSGFFGAYAASTPEEDFAEAFSAYVFRVEAKTDGQQARLDWIADQPGLSEYQERAIALGYGPLPHNFDACG